MKDQKQINVQIQTAEQELAALAAKRTALQDRIRQLQGLKQSIADEQLPFWGQKLPLKNEKEDQANRFYPLFNDIMLEKYMQIFSTLRTDRGQKSMGGS